MGGQVARPEPAPHQPAPLSSSLFYLWGSPQVPGMQGTIPPALATGFCELHRELGGADPCPPQHHSLGIFPPGAESSPEGPPRGLAPHIPAVDHGGPGVRRGQRPHFFQEFEHPDGGERHSKVRPAGEVQLAHQAGGFAAVGELLQRHGETGVGGTF